MTETEELLKQIALQLNAMPEFGQMQIHVKRHLGTFSNTDIVKMTSYRYTDNDPNVTCTSDIFKLIKQIADARVTGTLGLSVSFKNGRADLMQVQDFKKI